MHSVRLFGRLAEHHEHPACSLQSARAYFIERLRASPDDVYAAALPSDQRRAHLDLELPSIHPTLHCALRINELPMWSTYLRNGIHNKGWNSAQFQ